VPYIAPARRTKIDSGDPPENGGELNYLITITAIKTAKDFRFYQHDTLYDALWKICNDYLDREGNAYAVYNACIGALACARIEYKRRGGSYYQVVNDVIGWVIDNLYASRIAPYEDRKIAENGDIL
jgi:hypothetical protein